MRSIAFLLAMLLVSPAIAGDAAQSCNPPCTTKQQCYNGRCEAIGAKPVRPMPLPRKPPEKPPA